MRHQKLRPISWIGGKAKLAGKMVAMMPEHNYYCEVFGGGAACLFAKSPVKLEVYNDVDQALVNFFQVLRDSEMSRRLIRLLKFTPYARQEYYHCRGQLDRAGDRVEWARQFFVAVRQAFASTIGKGWGFDVREKGKTARAWDNTIRLLVLVQRRLKTVQVDCLDFRKCLERYNVWGRDGLIYIDPPYLPETRRDKQLYRHELSGEDHQWLIDWLIHHCRTNVMLSGYDSELYRSLETHGWRRAEFPTTCNILRKDRKRGIDDRRLEVVWMNNPDATS